MAVSAVRIQVEKRDKTGGGNEFAAYAPVVNASSPDNTTVQSFTAATFAAVTIPSGATGVTIIPPVANAGNITIKGITGDTGILLGVLTKPFWLPLVAASSSLGILCANTTVLDFNWT